MIVAADNVASEWRLYLQYFVSRRRPARRLAGRAIEIAL
jgi:hypothetical protein